MERHLLDGLPLLEGALVREARMGPACVEIARIGRASSADLQWRALEHCSQVDPLSYYVLAEMLSAMLPKWGGSVQGIQAIVDLVRQHMGQNPALQPLLAFAEMERRKAGRHEDAKAYLAAARLAPHADVLHEAAYRSAGWERVVYLTQVLRFRPDQRDARQARHASMSGAGLRDWAEVDDTWLRGHADQAPK